MEVFNYLVSRSFIRLKFLDIAQVLFVTYISHFVTECFIAVGQDGLIFSGFRCYRCYSQRQNSFTFGDFAGELTAFH